MERETGSTVGGTPQTTKKAFYKSFVPQQLLEKDMEIRQEADPVHGQKTQGLRRYAA